MLEIESPQSGEGGWWKRTDGLTETVRIGGVAVGEPKEAIRSITALSAGLLPEGKPRYLMGVGTPEDLVEAVYRGVDMFDCVMPTRNGRHGVAFTPPDEDAARPIHHVRLDARRDEPHDLILQQLPISGLVFVPDHQVDGQALEAPVGVRLHELPRQVDVGGVGDLQQHDRQVAGNRLPPQPGLAATVARQRAGIGVVGVNPNKHIKLHIVKVFADSGSWAYGSAVAVGGPAVPVANGVGAMVRSMRVTQDAIVTDGVLHLIPGDTVSLLRKLAGLRF